MRRELKIAARIFLGLFLFVALVAVALQAALTTNWAQQLLRSRIEGTLSQQLEREVQVGKVTFGLVLTFLELREVVVKGPEGTLLEVDYVRLYPDLVSLLKGTVAFRNVVFLRPVVDLSARPAEWFFPLLLIPSIIQDLLAVHVDLLQIRQGELIYPREGETWSVRGLDADLWAEEARVLAEMWVAEGILHLPHQAMAWRNLEALIVLTEQDVLITRLGIDVGEATLGFSGRIADPFEKGTLDLRLTGGIPLTLLSGNIRLEGQITGSPQNPNFRGRARIEGEKVPEGTLEISADQKGLRGKDFRFAAVPGDVSGGFYVRWKDLRYSGEVRGRGLAFAPLLTPLLGTLPMTGKVNLGGVVKGRGLTTTGLTAELTLQVSSLTRHDQPGIVGRMDAVVKGKGGRFTLERFRMDLSPNHLTAKGPLGKELNLRVSGNFPRMDKLGRFLGATGLGGKGRVKGKMTGSLGTPVFKGTVTWNAPRLGEITLRRVRGEVVIQNRRLTAPRLIITKGKSTATVHLRLALPEEHGVHDLNQDLRLEAEVHVRGAPRDFLSLVVKKEIPLTGRLTMDVAVAGTLARLEGRGHFLIKDAVLLGEPWPVVMGDLQLQPDRLRLKEIRLVRGAEHVTVSGLLNLKDLETTLRVATKGLSLEGFRLSRGKIGGQIQAEAVVEGRIDNPRISGDFQAKGLRYAWARLGNGRGRVRVQDQKMIIQLSLPKSGYSVWGIMGTTSPYFYNLQVTMDRSDLALLFALSGVDLLEGGTGTGTGRAELLGTLGSTLLSGLTVELDAPRILFDRYAFRTAKPILVEMVNDKLTISSFAVTGKTGWLNARGQINFKGGVDFDAQGKIPLALLLRKFKGIVETTGNGQFDVKLAGQWKAPQYVGWSKLERGHLRFTKHPEAFKGLTGWVKFQGWQIEIPTLEGRWAGGEIEVSGKASRGKRRWKWGLDVFLEGADGERVTAKKKGARGEVTGRASLWGKVTARGRNWDQLYQSVGGRLKVVFRKGTVRRFTVLANILRLLNLAPDPVEGVPYEYLKAAFDLKQGTVETHDLKFVSNTVKVSGVGKINLVQGNLDMLLGVQPLRTVDKVVNFLQLGKIPLLGHLLFGKEQSILVVAVRVKGPLQDPEVVPVPEESIGRGVFGILRRLLELPAELFPGEE
ncbi:MAG: AsmA-like C-terminal domain-containing protein [Candidatus Methylomirabilales bacterium]